MMNAELQRRGAARAVHHSSFTIHRFRRGFSFAEVMFAVVILGIGFIMVAAIFPVAIKQTQASVEESFTAAVSRNATAYMEQMSGGTITVGEAALNNIQPAPLMHATDLLLRTSGNDALSRPPRANRSQQANDGFVPGIEGPGFYGARGKLLAIGDLRVFDDGTSGTDPMYPLRSSQIREGYANAIVPTDPRYAYVPMYRRDRSYSVRQNTNGYVSLEDGRVVAEDSPLAQLVLFGVQVRNRTQFEQRDLPRVPNTGSPISIKLANLEPRPVAVRVGRVRDILPAVSTTDETIVAVFASAWALNGDTPRGGFPNLPEVQRILNEAPKAVAEGSFFVISDDRIINDTDTDPVSARSAGIMNGRIFRVGIERTDLGANVWELYPGYDFTPDPGDNGVFDTNQPTSDDIVMIGASATSAPVVINGRSYVSAVQVDGSGTGQGAVAFVMGRALSDNYINNTSNNPPAPEFEGTAIDVGVYTTMIKVK